LLLFSQQHTGLSTSIIIYITKQQKSRYVQEGGENKREKKTTKLTIQAQKGEKMSFHGRAHHVGLQGSLPEEAKFPVSKIMYVLLKMKSFLSYQISQATSMNTSMNKMLKK
jgi:hypothetical protein